MRPSLTASGGVPLGLCAILVSFLLPGSGCSRNDGRPASPGGEQPAGNVLAASDCGGFPDEEDTRRATDTQDCIEYDYDGTGTLAIRHVNAGFNCCPGAIAVPITVAGDLITLDETGPAAGCRCNCLFDVDLEIRSLAPGVYQLRVLEQLLQPGDPLLEFELRLTGTTTGSYCVERTHDPWGLGL